MNKIISITNQKSGTGKTITAVFLARILAEKGNKVLCVDADPQANATTLLGIDAVEKEGIYEYICEGGNPEHVILKTQFPNLYLLPSKIDLIDAEIELINLPNREFRMKEALSKIKKNYNFILIDCSPSLGLLTVNALTSADSVLIPISCEPSVLDGMGKLLNTIKIVSNKLNNDLVIEGFLLTLHEAKVAVSQKTAEEVKLHFENQIFNTIIPRDTIEALKPAYMLLAEEIISKSKN